MTFVWRPFKIFIVPFLSVIVCGCTFSVPQLESVITFAQSAIASNEATLVDGPATWLGSVDGRGAILNPYVSNQLIVFANADGDAIAFDGWTIRSVVGFGLNGPLSISGKDGVRTFTFAGQQTLVQCAEWRKSGRIWTQKCSNGMGEIVLDDSGNIQKITMAIAKGSSFVTLGVAK